MDLTEKCDAFPDCSLHTTDDISDEANCSKWREHLTSSLVEVFTKYQKMAIMAI